MREVIEPIVEESGHHGTVTKHPAFGMISVGRVSGRANLFMVDYPQDHYITLKVCPADLYRDLNRDWVHGSMAPYVEVSMSEVQWARLVSSLNTEGVPCTVEHFIDNTGKWRHPAMPEEHVGKAPTLKREVKARGQEATEDLQKGIELLEKLVSGPGQPKKSDLKEALKLLTQAMHGTISGISWVVQSAEEAIEKSVESAKAELSAYAEHTMQRLGKEALGEQIRVGGTEAVKIALLSENPPL